MVAADGTDDFFQDRKPAAVLKHGVLSRYVVPWAAKLGSAAPGGRVVVLDGYAGAGTYDDGTPGSPIIMAEAARNLTMTGARVKHIDLVFVEEKRPEHQKLCATLAERGFTFARGPLNARLESVLDEVIDFAGNAPLFAFLDPYGAGLSFDETVKILNRPGSPKTEILLNFSAWMVRRIGGLLKSEKENKGRDKTLARLDAVCGGDWWREMHDTRDPNTDIGSEVAREYMHRLCAAIPRKDGRSLGGWVVPVRKAAHRVPEYSLVFFSRHPDGIILFGNQVSLAQQDWRQAAAGEDLFGQPAWLKAEEERLSAQWTNEISGNVASLLAEQEAIDLGADWARVFGSTLGQARETHLRKALKQLHRDGAIVEVPRGDLWKRTIVRRPSR